MAQIQRVSRLLWSNFTNSIQRPSVAQFSDIAAAIVASQSRPTRDASSVVAGGCFVGPTTRRHVG